jgi:hypothetical protein
MIRITPSKIACVLPPVLCSSECIVGNSVFDDKKLYSGLPQWFYIPEVAPKEDRRLQCRASQGCTQSHSYTEEEFGDKSAAWFSSSCHRFAEWFFAVFADLLRVPSLGNRSELLRYKMPIIEIGKPDAFEIQKCHSNPTPILQHQSGNRQFGTSIGIRHGGLGCPGWPRIRIRQPCLIRPSLPIPPNQNLLKISTSD